MIQSSYATRFRLNSGPARDDAPEQRSKATPQRATERESKQVSQRQREDIALAEAEKKRLARMAQTKRLREKRLAQ